jgi:hypothetical protein
MLATGHTIMVADHTQSAIPNPKSQIIFLCRLSSVIWHLAKEKARRMCLPARLY